MTSSLNMANATKDYLAISEFNLCLYHIDVNYYDLYLY